MNSKQRVKAALNRQPSDRVPVFMWFAPETAQKLGCMLNIPAAAVGDVFGNDIRQTWVNNNYAMEGIIHDTDGQNHTDFWGIEWTKLGPFNQITREPLKGLPINSLMQYRLPWDHINELVCRMDHVKSDENQYFTGCDISPCTFELYTRLRGFEDALLDFAAHPRELKQLFVQFADFCIELSSRVLEKYDIDWLWLGDDLGSQQGMMVSPALWRKIIKPQLKRIIEVAVKHRLPVAYHSCGAIREVLPDLIEIGVNVLNPIQCNCEGMNPYELKKQFGKDLSFMGGVDTQNLLPNASSQEVLRESRKLVDFMSKDGGYILAASHTIPPETPLENIFAMYQAAGITKDEIYSRASRYSNAQDL